MSPTLPAAEASPGPAPPPDASEQPPRALLHRWARLAPFFVVPAYLLFVLSLQPEDELGARDDGTTHDAHPILFDDHDLVAMALRGYNASLGRRAGRVDEPDWAPPEKFARELREDRPLADRYYLEYPHTALVIFRLGFAWQGELPAAPAAFCDADYMNVVTHRPAPDERALYRSFRRAARTYSCLMAVCLLLLVAVLQRGYLAGGALSAAGAFLLLPGALYFSLFRFDVVPALLMAACLACLGRRWWAASAVLLAAAAMVKAYPVLLVPLVLRHLGLTSRRALGWLAVFALTVALFLLPSLAHDGWEGLWGPYRVQLSRTLEPLELTIYGYILPPWLGDSSPVARAFRAGTLLLAIALTAALPPGGLPGLLRRGAVVLIAFASLAVFYSPQWVLWLAPLLLPLARRSWALVGLLVVLDVVSYLSFLRSTTHLELLVYLRFAVLGAIAALLFGAEWRARHRKGALCDAAL